MKTNLNLFQVRMLCAGALGIVSASSLAATPDVSADTAPAKASIPWSQVGAKAGADYKGDGLAILPTTEGARLHCVFQRLEGEATSEGLWLTSTVSNAPNDRLRIVAAAVGRQSSVSSSISSVANTGTVTTDGQSVRFTRPGLVEEYSVSMDGVRQDFVVLERPAGDGELALQLAVSGARVEPASFGAQLMLENSGRKIAYSRLRATDATGKEMPARMEVRSEGDEATSLKLSHSTRDPSEKAGLFTSALLVVVNDAEAVYPIRIDPTFSDANWISMGGIPGANGSVATAVEDGAGNLYIGGGFTAVGDVLANRVAKWDGSSWSALGSGMNDWVDALAVLGNDLYAGGEFTTAGGSPANYIARWNGSSWTPLGSGVSGIHHFVDALAVLGGDVYAGGGFSNAGGIAAHNLAKWDGSTWSALGSGLNNGVDSYVDALAVSGGDVYVGGEFTVATNSNGAAVTVNHIAKWDGSSWSALGLGMNGSFASVYALVVSGSDLYAGGNFTSAGLVTAHDIAQWDGSSWSALSSGVVGGYVYAMAVSGSDLYAGGRFTAAGGTAATNIAKWNGSGWSPVGSGVNDVVDALAVSGGDLYAGGNFTTADGTAANYIAKWRVSSWSALGSGINGQIYALAALGSDLYAGGNFTTAGGVAATNIAKWNGSSWSPLGSGMDSQVYALVASGSDLYAAGFFTISGGSAANYIAKWNGSSWSALGSGVNGGVFALGVSGSDLYAGGFFTKAGSSTVNNIARWNGKSWSALGLGMDGLVEALAVSGSDLYAGGVFTTATNSGGVPMTANYIAKWNGSSWSALGSGVGNLVHALALSGGDLYVGGEFTMATNSGGVPVTVNRVAKWNGSSWSALGLGMDSYVSALAVSGSDLYAGGVFTTATNSGAVPVTANYIAKWNGSSWSALGSALAGGSGVYALAAFGTDVYAGGSFTMAEGSTANSIAKWNEGSWSALGSGMNGSVYALAVSGSDLYAGGNFMAAGGGAANFIAKWDGTGWSPLGSGMNDSVLALAVLGSDLYAGGYFTMAGGSAANFIAKWDGSGWSPLGSGVSDWVNALAVSGTNLYGGGSFTTATNSSGVPVTVNYVAKWNGTSWSALGLGVNSEVDALAVLGSDLYAGGYFSTAGLITAKHIAKWNGSSWNSLASGLNDSVCALAVSGTNLYAGGFFTTATNSGAVPVTVNYIAKWNGDVGSWSALGSGVDNNVRALAVSGSDLYAGGFFRTATNSGGVPITAGYIAKWNGTSWSALGSGTDDGVRALALSGSVLYTGGDFTTAGDKFSASAARAIVNPPVVTIEPDGGGGFFLRFDGVPGSAYRLQRAPSLKGAWASSAPQTAPASGRLEFWDVFPPPGQGFYRSVQP